MKPTYFNSGCCCFSDGDIHGIEIEDGSIRLIKWTTPIISQRCVLEERKLRELIELHFYLNSLTIILQIVISARDIKKGNHH
jgi:hypothetical protein